MAEAKVTVDTMDDQNCQPCFRRSNNRMADIFCSTCDEFQCYECSKIHELQPLNKCHKIMSVTEGQTQVSSTFVEDVDMKGMDICAGHKKQLEFYCHKHKALLCSQCVSISHKKCKPVDKIESMIGGDECNKLMNELSKYITSTSQLTEVLEEAENRLSDDIGNLPDKLKIMKTKLIQAFDEFSDDIMKEATLYGHKTKATWSSKKIKCKTKVKSMKDVLTTMETVVKNGFPYQIFIVEHRMMDEIKQIVKDANCLHEELSRIDVCCTLDEQFKKLKSSVISMLEPEEFNMKYRLPKPSCLKMVRSIDVRQTGEDAGTPFYSGLDFLPDGRLVAVDNYNGKFLLYDVNLNMKKSYRLPYNHPQCVVAVSDDEVVITSGNKYRLDFLNVSDSNDISLNRTCKVNAKYDSISMMGDQNLVVSTIDHIKPFRMLSMFGDEKDININAPSKKYPIDTNHCVYLCGRHQIIQCDRNEDKIYKYDIVSGERLVITDNKIKSPCGIAEGPYDHVFVGSNSTKCLLEITPGGRILSSHQLDMYYPCVLAVSKDKKLIAVSNTYVGASRLSLYKIT